MLMEIKTTDGVDGGGNGTYADFQKQFQNAFGVAWNESLNATPADAEIDGSLLDVSDMSEYDALVIVGGRGAVDYRLDDAYADQGAVLAATVEQVAQKLNDLAVEALLAGKPVMALCHGASLPAFFKVPGTNTSLLQGQYATGFPLDEPGEDNTATYLMNLGINYRSEDRVTISSPSTAFLDNGAADFKIITTRNWYTQSVAYAARTLLNILQSYPSKAVREDTKKVLILHGGALNAGDCASTNKDNDIPCNFGGDLPADYTNLESLLTANSPNDTYNFNVTEVDITNSLPNGNSQSEIEDYLADF